MKLAFQSLKSQDEEEAAESFATSADYYIRAAGQFFKDECHVNCLKVALEAYWFSGALLMMTLPVCKEIRDAIPDKKRICERSQAAENLGKWLDIVQAFEANYRKLLSEGRVTLQQSGSPEGLVSWGEIY